MIITADTAHGTNPASVTMAGFELAKVATTDRGNLDLDDLREKVDDRTAGLMLTNPSTLGLFDEGIEEVARIFHDAGRFLYYDGANLNAVVGLSRPGDMGFDIVHYNLHKTFSQPHGGGGPGGGPVAVRAELEPFLPAPLVVREGERYRLDHDRPKSIGRVRGFAGPFGVFVRSYAFMRAYGPALREMSEVAVLNANYLLARLRDVYDLPYDRHCMHEFVLSARTLKREHGITALDVAKRLMDHGIHPPTIYFPLVVPEALMIEPTETETKERLDEFVDAMRSIAARGGDRAGDAEGRAADAAGPPPRRGEGREAAGSSATPSKTRVRPIGSRAHDGGGGQRARRARPRSGAGRLGARCRPARAPACIGVHAPGRGRPARPGGVPPGGRGAVRDRRVHVRGDRPRGLREHRRARLPLHQVARLDGRDLTHRMHVTDIWTRREARWQIVRRHATVADG